MADEVQEVEATTMEVSPATLVDRKVAEAEAIRSTWAERYQPRVPTDEEDYRQAKRERSALRKEYGGIVDSRKALVGDLKDAIRRVELRFSDAIDEGKRLDAEYKDGLDAYERQVVDFQLGELRKAYEEMAPDMAGQVPFERIDAKWGEADGWHRRTANLVRMQEQLQGHMQEIADTERKIGALSADLPDEDADRWRAEYFRTLDFQEAARTAQDAREQRERLRALDAEREAREAYERDQAAQAEPYVPGESYVPTEAESAPETPREPKAAQVPTESERAPQTGDRRPSEASGYVYMLVAFPREQMGFAVAALRSIQGSHGKMTKAEEWWNK